MQHMKKDPRYSHSSLLPAWQITATKLKSKHPLALDWLNFCAYLFPDEIPQTWLEQWIAAKEPNSLEQELQSDDILRTLIGYALIKHNKEKKTLSIHRIRQDLVRESEPPQKDEVLHFLYQLGNELDPDQLEDWKTLIQWDLHVSWFLEKFGTKGFILQEKTLNNELDHERFLRQFVNELSIDQIGSDGFYLENARDLLFTEEAALHYRLGKWIFIKRKP